MSESGMQARTAAVKTTVSGARPATRRLANFCEPPGRCRLRVWWPAWRSVWRSVCRRLFRRRRTHWTLQGPSLAIERVSSGRAGFLGFQCVVIGELFLVLLDAAIELVGQRVDRGVHVHFDGVGVNR